jgi:hypothetical protein
MNDRAGSQGLSPVKFPVADSMPLPDPHAGLGHGADGGLPMVFRIGTNGPARYRRQLPPHLISQSSNHSLDRNR